MTNLISNKFWEMMGGVSPSTSLSRDSTSSSDSPSSLQNNNSTETRFNFRTRLTSATDSSPIAERRCMSTSTPPIVQTPPTLPAAPKHSSLSSVNRLVDSVFIDESPRRQLRHSYRANDSHPPGKAVSFDHFQFNLYQEEQNRLTTTTPICATNSIEDVPANLRPSNICQGGGKLSLQVHYNLEENQLEVTVIAASHLKSSSKQSLLPYKQVRPVSRHSSLKWDAKRFADCNPYVRLQLLPGRDEAMTTGVKRKTTSPVWNEKFTFPMSYQQSQKTSVELTVRDCAKDVCQTILGRVVVCLNDPELNLAGGEQVVRDILPVENNVHEIGDLFVSLQYLPSAGRLTIDVIKARNLLQRDCSKKPDTIVKVNFLCDDKLIKTKRTDVKRGTIHPAFNQSFRLNVTEDLLERTSCAISVYDYRVAGKDELVGRIILGGCIAGKDAPPTPLTMTLIDQQQLYHWEDMIRNPRSPIALWHSLKVKSADSESRSSISSIENGRSTASITLD